MFVHPKPEDQDEMARPLGGGASPLSPDNDSIPIPAYLEKYYWWAYVRPWAVWVFEREWLVNLILWGWYRPLRDAALEAWGARLPGKTLQISCCYGTLTPRLNERVMAGGGSFDVIDVSPAQLNNLRRKLPADTKTRIMRRDSTNLGLPDAVYDRVMLFFLPHEQPKDVRARTFAEAMRVLKPGGTILIIEFDKPKWWHPLKYLWLPFLAFLEPFAPDIWKFSAIDWLPADWAKCAIKKTSFFGGFYQRLVITKP